jgi:Domain of unknown function (DUF3786)
MEEQRKAYWEPKLWEELRSQNPLKVCERCKVVYNPTGFYAVESLGKTVKVYPGEERFEADDLLPADSSDYQLVLISYLLYAQNIESTGIWVSEKDLKGGGLFFRGPHALPAAPLEKSFGSNPSGFRKKSLVLGGKPLEFGDASMSIPILPRISFAIVLWTKDEEFPARVTFMLDSSIEAHLPLDVICAMTQSVVKKIVEN